MITTSKSSRTLTTEYYNSFTTSFLNRESNEIIKSVQNLKRFSVPPFMLNKMRDFVKHVQGNCTCVMYVQNALI